MSARIKEPSKFTYAIPIFLSSFGGLIGYFWLKSKNPRMAKVHLILGFSCCFVYTFVGSFILIANKLELFNQIGEIMMISLHNLGILTSGSHRFLIFVLVYFIHVAFGILLIALNQRMASNDDSSSKIGINCFFCHSLLYGLPYSRLDLIEQHHSIPKNFDKDDKICWRCFNEKYDPQNEKKTKQKYLLPYFLKLTSIPFGLLRSFEKIDKKNESILITIISATTVVIAIRFFELEHLVLLYILIPILPIPFSLFLIKRWVKKWNDSLDILQPIKPEQYSNKINSRPMVNMILVSIMPFFIERGLLLFRDTADSNYLLLFLVAFFLFVGMSTFLFKKWATDWNKKHNM